MGGGSSKGGHGGVPTADPVNALEMAKQQRTDFLKGRSGERSLFVRRGCWVEFRFSLFASDAASFTVDGKLEGVKCICKVASEHGDEFSNWKCSLEKAVTQNSKQSVGYLLNLLIPEDAPFSCYKLSFELVKDDKDPIATIDCIHTVWVLFNPFKEGSIDLNELQDMIIPSVGAIVTGASLAKLKRYWMYGQDTIEAMEVTMCLTKEIPRRIRSNPEKMASTIAENCASKLLQFWRKKRAKEREGIVAGLSGTDSLLKAGLLAFIQGKKDAKDKPQGGDDDDDSDDDDIFGENSSNDNFVELEDCWVLTGFYITLMRFIGIPARPVTAFNVVHDGTCVIKDTFPDKREGVANFGLVQKKKHTGLRLFNVWCELSFNGNWYVTRFEVDKEGRLRTSVDSLKNSKSFLSKLNPEVFIESTMCSMENMEPKLVQPSTLWTCIGDQFQLTDRTSEYLGPTQMAPIETNGDEQVSFSLQSQGWVGDDITLSIQSSLPENEDVEYTITVAAVNVSGKRNKVLRTFSGKKASPFVINREIEFDDYSAYVNKNCPALEFAFTGKISSNIPDDPADQSGDRLVAQYESLLLFPYTHTLCPRKDNGKCAATLNIFKPRKNIEPEEALGCFEGTEHVNSRSIAPSSFETFSDIIQGYREKLDQHNADTVKAARGFPFILSLFDVESSMLCVKTAKSKQQRKSSVACTSPVFAKPSNF